MYMYILLSLSQSRDTISQIKQKASEAREVLRTWSQSYLEVRKKIEQSGRDARWEFDRKRLFERTDYVSQICSDIYNVVQVRLHVLYCSVHFIPIVRQ